MTQFDVINKAQHYNLHPSGIEAIEVCRYLTGDWFNVFKYVFRAGHKNGREDLEKALYYAEDALKHHISINVWRRRTGAEHPPAMGPPGRPGCAQHVGAQRMTVKPLTPVEAAEQLIKGLAGEQGRGTDLWTPVQAYRRAYEAAMESPACTECTLPGHVRPRRTPPFVLTDVSNLFQPDPLQRA